MATTIHAGTARKKRHAQLARIPGVRFVKRPLRGGGSFQLSYTRSGPNSGLPLLVFAGGPGLASVLPYQGLRTKATKLGLGLIMMEHRGVGLSRTDATGADIPHTDITITDVIDDAAAILAAEGLDQVVVYGTSYGSYLAQGFGVKYPERVAGMILDSPMTGAGFGEASIRELHSLFWDGTVITRTHADAVRRLVKNGVVDPQEMFPLQFLYELGGPRMVHRMLSLLEVGRGKLLWERINRLGSREVMKVTPFMMEFDLVGEIAFRELGFAPTSHTAPLKLSNSITAAAAHFSSFQGEPFPLHEALPAFAWPTVVISGDHDIRTPRPVAEHIVALVPDAVLIPVRGHGHSALDVQNELALAVMRAVTTSIGDTGALDRTRMPIDATGKPNLMKAIVALSLGIARFLPNALS